MIRSSEHVEIRFLIKAFAWWSTEADAIMQFENFFNKQPTRRQLTYANLGRYLHDSRPNVKNNHRVKLFKMEREKAKAEMRSVAIADDDWRMWKLQKLFEQSEERAKHTGNTARCTDILRDAAKEGGGMYAPKTQTLNIDNRSVNVNLSDEEINKRLSSLLQQFNISIPDMPLIERGAKPIEHQEDWDSEQQG